MTDTYKARVITSVLFFKTALLPADDWRVVQVVRQSPAELDKSYAEACKLWENKEVHG